MKLGLFNMPLHPPGRLHADTYDEDLDLMSFADELGYAEAWIGEHFTTEWENMPAPDLFIARALGVTRNLVMGTGVSLLAFHDPVMIAHRMAMLDHLARGRFFFGIGSGGVPTDSEMFGMDRMSGQQRNRMREAAELIVSMWTVENPGEFHFEGEHYDVKLPASRPEMGLAYHMRPYQKPHPPIAVAGSSPSSPNAGGRWRTGLVAHEHPVPAPHSSPQPLGHLRPRRSNQRPRCFLLPVAHRPRGLRRGNDRTGRTGRHDRPAR